ncbi:hypothetical protein [Pseudomonas pseudonitroreducens]|uniref:hypothetical protein n=1 Tax=Pseudomonas pseudonitroreducens TaxID=2892326 RepID=UPI001F406B9D|nr:hypothetical protein [Pseudomonas pseudonitroreducens]
MKPTFVLLAFALFSSTASAEIDWDALAKEKAEARKEMSAMSCEEFKAGLAELADSVDVLRTVDDRNTNDYEMMIFGVGLALKKAESCIN